MDADNIPEDALLLISTEWFVVFVDFHRCNSFWKPFLFFFSASLSQAIVVSLVVLQNLVLLLGFVASISLLLVFPGANFL